MRSFIPGTLVILLLMLFVLTTIVDPLVYRLTFPIQISISSAAFSVRADNRTLTTTYTGSPKNLIINARPSVLHEYQIDGTDSTNTDTIDIPYLQSIRSWWYYRFNDWMRNLDGASVWRDMSVQCSSATAQTISSPFNGEAIPLSAAPCTIQTVLQMPETTAGLTFRSSHGDIITFSLNRNDHQMRLFHNGVEAADSYFPTTIAPFAAGVLDFIVRSSIWSVLLLLASFFIDSLMPFLTETRLVRSVAGQIRQLWAKFHKKAIHRLQTPTWANIRWIFLSFFQLRKIFTAIHPIALIIIGFSFLFTVWIAIFQYWALPHIYDASAYLFGAKILLSGHLALAPSPISNLFPAPFMVIHQGKWFTQYPPGTSFMLAIGLFFHTPWLVEPLLGAASLVGIYAIAAQLYQRSVAILAVLLGALSPFYTYLAASYMSHTIALFYLVWGSWCVIQILTTQRWRYALAAGFLFGMAALVRDLIAVLYIGIIMPGMIFIFWRQARQRWRSLLTPALLLGLVSMLFFVITLSYNAYLTGDPFTTPRSLFFNGDRWGFGTGIGFYGQNTLAAGFITVDELLTSLAIDLFGWPFYLTLAFLPMPFILRKSKRADWVMALGFMLMAGAFLGYYYHGIYLGPRYLYETLPFVLILTARGILAASEWSIETAAHLRSLWKKNKQTHSTQMSYGITAILLFVIGCNLLYFFPRQITLHTNFTGMSSSRKINTAELGYIPAHHSIVATTDAQLYGYTLFALNSPSLNGDVVYALISGGQDVLALQKTYPDRPIYLLLIDLKGNVHFTELLAPSR